MSDRDWLLAEIGRLEREEAALSKLRRRLHEQIDRGISNDTLLQRERDVSDDGRSIAESTSSERNSASSPKPVIQICAGAGDTQET